ncbi:FAD-dependent oxidoreductase [Mycobacterium intracellulare]|uniref:FAD-dependent oxidoreductase n=1 Tax=Mycobacterium intracellulare subsp. chimaera TaxID=222805 RepID=A0A220YE67_MYCIT|nr:FAD-dependent oxidoreductase [Mycobacterium intracellulare]ARV82627.1 pyridine nucleotide-disulfide oxidoreductase [Mycobacterium intracellulare subsp. chimaera]ASL09898.1 pyridine nucleotide-disulfide oxidoreductase, putative [Mycobacterium intracellulare subsp. chimaera]ASL15579.1 pyridine nucleotide-disulfide oxidoreductase, putative [Mycobacterium intracellulare subsp. chimaera]ASL21702.1 pyridine nucleotide-disulfide oxidoreductase, putative [Mycobacterium intracellulare subsp. chimaera
MNRKRVVVAGLGDAGVLAAIRLSRHADVVGISTKPALVSGQELGVRLSRPHDWARDYWIPFDRFRRLDRVRTVQATLTGVDLGARIVFGRGQDGATIAEPYDALVISTGVSNGFWRQPTLQSAAEIGAGLRAAHDRLAAAESVIVVGGGAAAVSSALNMATTWPDKRIDLYFPRESALQEYHPRTWQRIRARLSELGVGVHPGHRAVIGEGFAGDELTDEPVRWSTGQPPADADAVLWAVGRVRPNTGWLPPELLDERGFVCVTPDLRVPGQRGVFALGDVAATDPLRSSARNRGDALVARNVLAQFAGRPLRTYRAPTRRWGSLVGIQPNGLEVFLPTGHAFRFPSWSVERVVMPWFVRWGMYRGVRQNNPLG